MNKYRVKSLSGNEHTVHADSYSIQQGTPPYAHFYRGSGPSPVASYRDPDVVEDESYEEMADAWRSSRPASRAEIHNAFQMHKSLLGDADSD